MADAELGDGLAFWEDGRYLEALEEFEHLWLREVGPRRQFLRGLIHAAIGFYYATRADVDAARSKLTVAADLLVGFPGDYLGVDVDGLRVGIASALAAVRQVQGGTIPGPGDIPVPRLLLREAP
jgi:hypothetical protein